MSYKEENLALLSISSAYTGKKNYQHMEQSGPAVFNGILEITMHFKLA